MNWWRVMRDLSLREAEEPDAEEAPEEGAEDPEEGGDEGRKPDAGQAQPATIPEDALPDFLRGQPPDQVRRAIENAMSVSREATQELRELKREVDQLKSRPAREEPKEEEEGESLDELLYKDPEAAIDRVVRKRYGAHIAGIEKQVGETVWNSIRSEVDGFTDAEDDVREILEGANAPATRDNILGAYQMVLGRQALEERAQKRRKAENPERPKPAREKPKKPQITDLEREFMEAQGMTEEEWVKYRDDDFEIKVPTG